MIGTTNRILAHAAKLEAQMATGHKPDGSPMGDLAALDKSLDLELTEWFGYQNTQAKAHVLGKLTTAEAQTVYMALNAGAPGATGWAPETTLALKVTITNLMGELLGVTR